MPPRRALTSTGEFLGYIGSVIDITERKQAEQTQQLLVDELNHRVKNTLASVQAIVQHTLRRTQGSGGVRGQLCRSHPVAGARALALKRHDLAGRRFA